MVRRGLLAVVLVALVACSSGSEPTFGVIDPSFKRFDGTTGTLADYRGKPLVMNFFSSTCIPCQSEMPALEKVHQTLGDEVTFLGMDVQDTVEGGQAFVKTVGITWELGRDPTASIMQEQLKATRLPTTALVDRTGKVVLVHEGALDVDKLTGMLREHNLIK